MQKFTYHCHTNGLGIFDGQNTASEMITKAEEIGFEEIGISNHFVFHPNIILTSSMSFNDSQIFIDKMKQNVEDIRRAAEKASIKVYVGFEVDFFQCAAWRNCFEQALKELDADYYIGSTHYLRNDDESKIYNFYQYKMQGGNLSEEEIKHQISNYWQNICVAAESGYFDFIAHLDVYKIFPEFAKYGEDEDKIKVIETLARLHHPVELNTSGWRKCGEQHPDSNILKALCILNVPIVISDDAHNTDQLGGFFIRAESLLTSLGCKNRWRLNK